MAGKAEQKLQKDFDNLQLPEKLFNIIRNAFIILNDTLFDTTYEKFTSIEIKNFFTFPDKVQKKTYFNDTLKNYFLTQNTEVRKKTKDLDAGSKTAYVKKHISNIISTIYVIGIAQLLKIYYDDNFYNDTDYTKMSGFFNDLLTNDDYKDVLRYKFTNSEHVPNDYAGRLLMEVFFILCFVKNKEIDGNSKTVRHIDKKVDQNALYLVDQIKNNRDLSTNILKDIVENNIGLVNSKDTFYTLYLQVLKPLLK
jgi:hypothetical protein